MHVARRSPPQLPVREIVTFPIWFWVIEPPPRLHLFSGREATANTDKIASKMTSLQQLQAAALGGSEIEIEGERREKEREEGGREQLTRSDTGKRGDLIAQLAKSWGRKQQGGLVPQSGRPLCCFWWAPSSAASPHPSPHPPLPRLYPSSPPRCCLSRLTTSEQNDQLSPPREHGSSWEPCGGEALCVR